MDTKSPSINFAIIFVAYSVKDTIVVKVAQNYSYVASTTAINNAAASQLPAIKLITR